MNPSLLCVSQPGAEAEADCRVPGGGRRGAHLRLRQALHAGTPQHVLAPGAQAHPGKSRAPRLGSWPVHVLFGLVIDLIGGRFLPVLICAVQCFS